MMSSKRIAAMMIAAGGACAPALAQDSVSAPNATGLRGDGMFYADAAAQKNTYVVDLSPLTTSWGTRFGVAPIIKSSKLKDEVNTANPDRFFNTFFSAQAISQTIVENNIQAPDAVYWSMPGGGINPVRNNPGLNQVITPCNARMQFGVGAAESGTERARLEPTVFNRFPNNIVGGIVRYNPQDPGRLFVTRTMAAVNINAYNGSLTDDENRDRSQFGFGSVDANGNIYFRADNNLIPVTVPDRLEANNVFRVRMIDRNAASTNLISNLGGGDAGATDWLVVRNASNHLPPSNIPADLAGNSTGRMATVNFNIPSELVVEGQPINTTFLAAPRVSRGAQNFSQARLFPGSVGTMAILARDSSTGPESVFGLQLWGVTGAGAVVSPTYLRRPMSLVDRCNDFVWENSGESLFRHYQSQVAFRGNAAVAVGKDVNGRGLAAATMYHHLLTGNNNPWNAIACARFDPANPQNAEWGLIAWIDFNNFGTPLGGKAILDGPGGNAIGRLCSLSEVTGGSPFGPSISAPVFDAYGNCYFISSVELYNRLPGGGSDFDNALIRAVYNPATFCWELDLVLELGSVFAGQNSGLNWQVRFLEIADSDSVSSATMWAANGMQTTWANATPDGWDAADPRWLGGLVLQARILYDAGDRDGNRIPDGRFDDPTGTNPQFPNSADEPYFALIYVGATPEPCRADFNGDGQSDFFDYLDFVQAFNDEDCAADFNRDGQVDFFDYLDFVQAFDEGCE